jgi:hypothetical protein
MIKSHRPPQLVPPVAWPYDCRGLLSVVQLQHARVIAQQLSNDLLLSREQFKHAVLPRGDGAIRVELGDTEKAVHAMAETGIPAHDLPHASRSRSAELARACVSYLENSPLVAGQELWLFRGPFQKPPVHGVGHYVNGQEAHDGHL